MLQWVNCLLTVSLIFFLPCYIWMSRLQTFLCLAKTPFLPCLPRLQNIPCLPWLRKKPGVLRRSGYFLSCLIQFPYKVQHAQYLLSVEASISMEQSSLEAKFSLSCSEYRPQFMELEDSLPCLRNSQYTCFMMQKSNCYTGLSVEKQFNLQKFSKAFSFRPHSIE